MPNITINVTDAEAASLDEAIAVGPAGLTRERVALAAVRRWCLRWVQTAPANELNPGVQGDKAVSRETTAQQAFQLTT